MNDPRQTMSSRAREGRHSTDLRWEQYLEEPFLGPSNATTQLTTTPYYRLNLPPEPITHTDWPPSIREHAEHLRYAPSSYSALYSGPPPGIPLPRTPPHRTMTTTPLSFYSRSMERGFPEMQYGVDIFMDEAISPALPRITTQPAIDELDETVSFITSDYSAGSLTSGSSVPDDDPTASFFTGSLQYHLIGTPVHPSLSKEHLQTAPTTPRSTSRSTSAHSHSHPYSHPQIPPQNRTATCPLCPAKNYTGRYATRNLARHMEAEHTPIASPDGVRHIPCSNAECDSTFRRDDARLVHERKSHPELGRSPAVKRKRGDER